MEISESMIKYYLSDITVSWFNNNDMPPDNIAEYHHCVIQMKTGATKHGDLNVLKLAFEYLLGNRQINCEKFAGDRYPFDDDEMREIIHYAWKTIWPDADPIPAGGPPNIKLVQMSLEDWWKQSKVPFKNNTQFKV